MTPWYDDKVLRNLDEQFPRFRGVLTKFHLEPLLIAGISDSLRSMVHQKMADDPRVAY